LRGRLEDELTQRHAGAVLATSLALVSDGALHLISQESKPVLNVAFSYDRVEKLDVFGESSKLHVNFVDVRTIIFVKGYGGDTSVELFEVILELFRVRSHRQDFEEIVSRAEIESGEESTLATEISIKLLLAMLKLRLESRELLSENIVGAAEDYVGGLISTLHNLQPGLVDLLESGSILRQGLSNISLSKHSHKRLPEALNLKPFL